MQVIFFLLDAVSENAAKCNESMDEYSKLGLRRFFLIL